MLWNIRGPLNKWWYHFQILLISHKQIISLPLLCMFIIDEPISPPNSQSLGRSDHYKINLQESLTCRFLIYSPLILGLKKWLHVSWSCVLNSFHLIPYLQLQMESENIESGWKLQGYLSLHAISMHDGVTCGPHNRDVKGKPRLYTCPWYLHKVEMPILVIYLDWTPWVMCSWVWFQQYIPKRQVFK